MYEQSRPMIPAGCKGVLDVGCGDGASLMDAGLPSGAFSAGVDVDLDRLQAGRRKLPTSHFIQGMGEDLPFGNDCVDAYISRVSWPYMSVPQTAREAFRVLRPGGFLWVTLHPLNFVFRHWLRSFLSLRIKDAIFRAYVICNGLVLHLAGVDYRFPFGRRRCESFQSNRGMRRVLAQIGFKDIKISRGTSFIVTARK
jgi:SAM-dependent methyltransferase